MNFDKDTGSLREWEKYVLEGGKKYHNIFHNHHIPMLIIDNESGQIVDANLAACSYYGYARANLLNMSILDINTLNKKDIFKEMNIAKKEERKLFRFKHKLSTGEIRDVEVYSGPITIDNRTLLFSVIHDIQERKECEKKFKIQESYFNDLFENSPEAIAILDKEFKIADINKSFEEMFLHKLDEIKNKSITEVLCSEEFYSESMYIRNNISRGEFVRKETLRKRKDGYLIDVSFLGFPIVLNGEQIGIYFIYSDLRMIKEEEKKYIRKVERYLNLLKISKEKAEEANELKTRFLANISHEIRTPISGILGIIDMLEETQPSKNQKEYISLLKFSAERLLSIINDILDISKIEAGKLELREEQFSAYKLLNKLTEYFRIQAENKGIKFISSVDRKIPNILIGDFERLNQVLFNLLGNAIKFTERGSIQINVKLIGITNNNAQIKFSISDTGIGIPKEQFHYIFERFAQVNQMSNRKYGGTGLGLALSEKLVELMGGKIYVKSKYNSGSTFSFVIKFNIASQNDKTFESLSNETVDNPISIPEGLNILVAEDETVNQIVIKNIFSKEKCNLTMVDNGKEVIEILNQRKFDLIFLDICMPEVDGCEVTRYIREKEKVTGEHVPIIAISAVALKEEMERHLTVGFDEYMIKPLKKKQVLYNMIKLLNNEDKSLNFNINALIYRLDGDNELLIDIIDEVVSASYRTRFLGSIEKYIDDENYEELHKSIHKFGGSISHFGAEVINNVLRRIGIAIKDKNQKIIRQEYDNLQNEFEYLVKKLIEYREKQK
ncbi:MAG: PAS domain S-box protein [Bacillota bacterium]|nr:PAS domain S-box protein [Bacillota bacterium]